MRAPRTQEQEHNFLLEARSLRTNFHTQKVFLLEIFGACGTGPGRPGPAPQTYFIMKNIIFHWVLNKRMIFIGNSMKIHTPYTIHHTPYTTHHTPHTIHHTPYTTHHTPHTIHFFIGNSMTNYDCYWKFNDKSWFLFKIKWKIMIFIWISMKHHDFYQKFNDKSWFWIE